jgi:hypothetical protein
MTGSASNPESRDSGFTLRVPRNDGFNATRSSTETSARGRCGACRTIMPKFLPRRFNSQTARRGPAPPSNNTSRSRGAIRARAWPEISSPCSRRGRGECRVPNAPAAWCALGVVKYAHQYSQRRHRKHPAFPRANGFTTYFALSPGTGLSCPRHRRDAQASSPTWHQRRDARTTRLRRPHRKALVSRSACGHRIPPPTFMTIAKRPSCGGRTGGANHTFLKNRSEIFLRAGLDTPSSLKGLGKLIFRRRALRRAGPRAHRAARARNSPSGELQLRKMGSPITTNVWVVQS